MNTKLVVGAGAALLLGAGLWIGHATRAKPADAPVTQPRGATASPAKRDLSIPRSASVPQAPARMTPPGLADDLRDADPRVRGAAIREAAQSDSDPAIFLAASRDPDRDVGVAAMEALGKLHARGEVPVQEMIVRAIDHALDERVRVSALNGLGLVPSPEAAQTLVELVHRGDTLEKRTAAILLAHQDLDVATPALIDALGDGDDVVRANAAEALRARARGRDFGSDAGAWRAWWQSRSR